MEDRVQDLKVSMFSTTLSSWPGENPFPSDGQKPVNSATSFGNSVGGGFLHLFQLDKYENIPACSHIGIGSYIIVSHS